MTTLADLVTLYWHAALLELRTAEARAVSAQRKRLLTAPAVRMSDAPTKILKRATVPIGNSTALSQE
jgi:hypothetical protein